MVGGSGGLESGMGDELDWIAGITRPGHGAGPQAGADPLLDAHRRTGAVRAVRGLPAEVGTGRVGGCHGHHRNGLRQVGSRPGRGGVKWLGGSGFVKAQRLAPDRMQIGQIGVAHRVLRCGVHGDFFDSITMTKKWLAILGDYGYDLLLHLNVVLNFFRKRLGIKKYWSLSKYVKDNVKSSVSFISDFELVLSNHAKNKGYDGIICGHIHKAEIKDIDKIEYLNCGDWVESCTAIVETFDGEFKIIDWLDKDGSK